MSRVVYIDVLFCFNALVDYLLLLCAALIMKQTGHRVRMALAALFGGLYAAVAFFPELMPWESLIGKLLCSCVMTLIAFGYQSRRRFLKLLACLFAVTFAFGGGLYAIYFFIYGGDGFMMRNGLPYMELPVGVFILSFAAVFALVFLSYRLFSRGGSEDSGRMRVRVAVDGRSAELTALMDSGNSLCEPISQNPVMVADFRSVKQLIPSELWPAFRDGESMDGMAALGLQFCRRFRLVPYSSVGKEGGLLPAFRPDTVELMDKGGARGLPGVIIAVSPGKLSSDGAYQAILNPNVKATV